MSLTIRFLMLILRIKVCKTILIRLLYSYRIIKNHKKSISKINIKTLHMEIFNNICDNSSIRVYIISNCYK